MEKSMEFEQKRLINIELTQGKELASQLKDHLESTREAGQNCEFLVEKIISSYEKALSMLKSRALIMEDKLPATGTLESPRSISSDSPTSQISNQSNKNVLKRRLPEWSEKVEVSLETGVEKGSPSDGYSWRKYGQKDILGANFPRAYYRCTHRNTRGCFATKQVQKSEENPSLLQVRYRGRHTCQCHQATLVSHGKRQKKGKHQTQNENKIPEKTEEKTINFGEGLDGEEMLRLPYLSFPSTLMKSENVENYLFSMDLGDNDFVDSYSQPFITQDTSESSYFSLSPTSHLNNLGVFHCLRSSESDVTEILSYPNSVTNYPIGDLDMSLEKLDFDPNFPLDILEFFP